MIYRTLLRLYPHDFRRAYADELEGDFAEQCREALAEGGRRALIGCWFHNAVDLLWSIPREWLRTAWVPVVAAAALIAVGVFYYAVGRIYRVRSFHSVTQPPESPELLLLMGLMVLIPVAGMILIAAATRFASSRGRRTRRRV
jgi:hypothetical protein